MYTVIVTVAFGNLRHFARRSRTHSDINQPKTEQVNINDNNGCLSTPLTLGGLFKATDASNHALSLGISKRTAQLTNATADAEACSQLERR